ncbi:MAG: iron-containing alcohol dehydrogenase [Thermoleophilaceae bacterium]|nr:iron-containing alcohol dehydrogenase [Thermoleophilaceae bacterium]
MAEEIDQLIAAIASTRQIRLPQFLRSVEGSAALAAELAEVLRAVDSGSPLLVSGSSQSAAVSNDLAIRGAEREIITGNTRAEVERIAATAARDHDALIAVGGGRPIDVAKSAALIADLPVVIVPTQLSADGIASPISVIAEAGGEVVSERSALPVAVVADLETVAAAPIGFARAGVGDLLGNRSALVDWQIAADAGADTVDDFAALLSSCALLLIEGLDLTPLGRGELPIELARRLLDGLVLSGLAMEIAGSSRPCSGSEHLISHSLDRLEPGTASHGEQVAFGTLIATSLQGGDVVAVRELIAAVGMNAALSGFGLGAVRLADVIANAPATRPGRHTVLDRERPSGQRLRELLAELIQLR